MKTLTENVTKAPIQAESKSQYKRLAAQHWPPVPPNRECTCHPNDNPPNPCPQRYALSDCRAAAAATSETPETDNNAVYEDDSGCWKSRINGEFVYADFVRDLERRLRLAEKNKTLARNNRWLKQTTNKELIALGKRAEAAERELKEIKEGWKLALSNIANGVRERDVLRAELASVTLELKKLKKHNELLIRQIKYERN